MEVYLREQPRYHCTSTERETPTCPPKSTHNGCRASPPKTEIVRGTPSRKSTTRHLQQARPKGVALPRQRHPITPTISQKCSPRNPPRAVTTISTTTHTPSRSAVHKQQPPTQPQSTAEEIPADMKIARYPHSTSWHIDCNLKKDKNKGNMTNLQ